ncbi:MAG: hypothetical protein COZ50_03550, partial [Zetaproteobacteria bacterium CG_4_10_14_3_um_filter_54_28]
EFQVGNRLKSPTDSPDEANISALSSMDEVVRKEVKSSPYTHLLMMTAENLPHLHSSSARMN